MALFPRDHWQLACFTHNAYARKEVNNGWSQPVINFLSHDQATIAAEFFISLSLIHFPRESSNAILVIIFVFNSTHVHT